MSDAQKGLFATVRSNWQNLGFGLSTLLLGLVVIVWTTLKMTALSEDFLVFIITLLVFCATEFFFPPKPETQKHFWAIVFTAASLVIGYTIKESFDTLRKIENVGAVFSELANKKVQQSFQEIFVEYHRHFDRSDPVLQRWALSSLTYLQTSMSRGWIPIPREMASIEIGRIYPEAHESIVATNVGDPNSYLGDSLYLSANEDASARGVAIVRFYLVSFRDFPNPKDLAALRDKIRTLHAQSGALYSAMMDIDKLKDVPQIRDVLIMDNRFVAETEIFQPTWQPLRAKATQDPDNLADVRLYLRALMRTVPSNDENVFEMKPELVQNRFSNRQSVRYRHGAASARAVYEEVMREILGLPGRP